MIAGPVGVLLGPALFGTRLLDVRLVPGSAAGGGSAMRVQTTFSTRFLSFLRCELVSRSSRVGGSTSFSPGIACLVRGEFVGTTLRVGRLPTLAGDLPLLLAIHGGKSPAAFFCHVPVPFVP